MPHLRLEYPADLINDQHIEQALTALQQCLVDSRLFDISHIRLRAIPLQHYRLAGERQGFIHVECRIHRGRSEQQKQQLSQAIAQILQAQAPPVKVITVEITEIERSAYTKIQLV